MTQFRQVYMVLSPRSLLYARDALDSLFRNSAEALRLRLITDSKQDKERLSETVESLDSKRHKWEVYSEEDLSERDDELFAGYGNLHTFRRGHPCWRKITDPILLSEPDAELVLLDPDLYFPNRFQFEETPQNGLLLMWQHPNCLYPPAVVKTAIESGIALAHHVDIGVAHWRACADLDWMNWLVGKLGGDKLPRIPHVEAIVWSALAMRIGGGHLDPTFWKCWHRSPAKRVMTKLGVKGVSILRAEPWSTLKCFHAAGEGKWWLHEAREAGFLDCAAEHLHPGRIIPFVELTPRNYARERAFKRIVQALGYYQVFRSAS